MFVDSLLTSKPGMTPSQPGLKPKQPARPQASGLAGWVAGWPRGGREGQTDERMKNLRILQNLVPYQGPYENQENLIQIEK